MLFLLINRSTETVECILQNHLQNEKFLGGKIFALMTKYKRHKNSMKDKNRNISTLLQIQSRLLKG